MPLWRIRWWAQSSSVHVSGLRADLHNVGRPTLSSRQGVGTHTAIAPSTKGARDFHLEGLSQRIWGVHVIVFALLIRLPSFPSASGGRPFDLKCAGRLIGLGDWA